MRIGGRRQRIQRHWTCHGAEEDRGQQKVDNSLDGHLQAVRNAGYKRAMRLRRSLERVHDDKARSLRVPHSLADNSFLGVERHNHTADGALENLARGEAAGQTQQKSGERGLVEREAARPHP